jgi:hypothetical protein
MKFLVGVMHCIENEFEECKIRILSQVGCEIEVFVISNLPNKEAHAQLYRRFEGSKDKFEYFVKVDADMVISSDRFFQHISRCFSFWPEVTHLEFPVFDHFTKRNIYGLHAWRRSHQWQVRDNEEFFADRANGKETKVRFGLETPAVADHCPAPSLFQAYHYGVHKAVKVTQLGRKLDMVQAQSHWLNFCELESVYRGEQSLMTALPVLGFLDAVANRWGPAEVNYSCEETLERCKDLGSKTLPKLDTSIRRDYALFSRRRIPSRLRMYLAQEHRSTRSIAERILLLRRLLRI